MPEYPPGMPCWVDLHSPDPEAAARFYAGLLGWEGRPDPAGTTVLTLRGRSVAGLGPQPEAGVRAAWITYVSVADVVAVTAAARKAGGAVLSGPTEVAGAGRLAVVSDPGGAAIGAWQPDGVSGAELINRPGSYCWSELATRNAAAAGRFYEAVFGWAAALDRATGYTEWMLVDRTVAGMMTMDAGWPADVPPHWMVYVAVEDCDAAASRAPGLGGAVLAPPADVAPGRLAVVEDPHGAVLSLVQLRRSA